MQQLNNNSFFRDFFVKATEHSKRLTVIDTIVYCVLMIGLITIMTIWPVIAQNCVEAIGYTTAAYVALRATYGVKSGVENYAKIKSNFNTIVKGENNENPDEGTLG